MHRDNREARRSGVEDGVAWAIQSIVRAVDLHSRWFVLEHGLTGPQIATLRAACRCGHATAGELARAVRLSQPTITGILDRLERKGLLTRSRSAHDRRTITVTPTPSGIEALQDVPSVLHTRFRQQLAKLPDWEQMMILATLQRVASMMSVPSEAVFANAAPGHGRPEGAGAVRPEFAD
jgi:DNA-binding MarR family transcriptional regulator